MSVKDLISHWPAFPTSAAGLCDGSRQRPGPAQPGICPVPHVLWQALEGPRKVRGAINIWLQF